MVPLTRLALFSLAIAVAFGPASSHSQQPGKPMSFHNRLLLNRLAVNGHTAAEVLLLTTADQFDHALARLERLDGHATRTERAIGYIRATVPLEKLLELVDAPGVEAYQVASLSKAGWYLDAAPQENTENFRRYEVSPVVLPSPPAASALPSMTVDTAHRINRAADADVGIDEWLEQHPTYDGRGVTIALLESALAEFTHPAFQSAKTLDGTDIPKFAGIFNPMDLDEADGTRVDLATEISAVSTWHRIGARTYILPRPGRYRFGLFTLPAGANLTYQFGVLRDVGSGEIWVDTAGDADFREETPIPPSEHAIHTQLLRISSPREVDIAFAVTEGRSPRHLNVYAALDNHQTMTASVAAGNRGPASLAYGVAPGARVLLVRNTPADGSVRTMLEAYLDTMQRTDVDIVCASSAITVVPASSADFIGLFLARLMATYKKPIVHAGGNGVPRSTSTWSVGEEFAVGGATSPATAAELYGVEVDSIVVDPRAAAGPLLDGALKPDFVAPVNRIAASLLKGRSFVFPTSPSAVLPPVGYEISCCTSATSPYAAGVIALLISAAKQMGVPHSVPSLKRALHASARMIPGWSSYQQGAGLMNVISAWAELQREDEFPVITATGPNAHLLSPYAAGAQGPGLFEREGWRAGMTGQRHMTFTRVSGTAESTRYRLSWTGNDGTFETAHSIVLPLHKPATLPIRIHPSTSGAHSALLNLHDPATDAIVLRAQAMVVAAEPFHEVGHDVRLTGTLSLFESREHFVSVPRDVQAMRLNLHVRRGRPAVAVVRSDTLRRNYYWHLDPSTTRHFPPGKYSVMLPLSTAGAWSITISNSSPVRDRDRASASTAEAEYDLSVQLLKNSLTTRFSSPDTVAVDVTNLAAPIREPAIDMSTGTLRTHEGQLSTDGLPQQISIDVPPGSATLMLKLRGVDTRTDSLDLHLYDCTSGECFSYDFTLPPGPSHTLVVRAPKAGRWIAAVNSAPAPARRSRFVLEEILTGNVVRHEPSDKVIRPHGARWREQLHLAPSHSRPDPDATPIVLFELIDTAAERDARAHPWENHEALPNLAERSVAIGTAILRVP